MSKPALMPVAEAQRRLLAALRPLTETEAVSLAAAYGRVLAEPARTPHPLPPFTNSAMDGFAVRANDVAQASPERPVVLRVIGDAPAGHPFTGQVGPGEAVRITTGAPLPPGADAVVPVEHTDAPSRDPGAPLPERVAVYRPLAPGDFVRPAGQDAPQGAELLPAGRRLRPQDVALLAMAGLPTVQVYRKPRVAFLSSGDELLTVDEPLTPGKIYDANAFTLRGLIATCGAEPLSLGIAPDRAEEVRARLERAVQQGADLILTSAGVSVGAFDFVRQVITEQGELAFWRVNMRPGKPLAFGRYRGVPVIGLPGNPVSAFVGFEVFVRPALQHLSGVVGWQRVVGRARLLEAVRSDGRETFLRGELQVAPTGWVVRPVGHQGSGDLFGLARATALIHLPAGVTHLPAEAEATVWPLHLF